TFQPFSTINPVVGGLGLTVADLNGDGNPDIVGIENIFGVAYLLGNGDGTFQQAQTQNPGQVPLAVAVADVGSQVTLPDGSTALGPADGHPDLIVADNGLHEAVVNGPPQAGPAPTNALCR